MNQSERLAMLTRVIHAAGCIDPEAAAWLARGLHLATTGTVATLDEGLGIRGRGLARLATRERLARRDSHVRRAFTLIPFDETTTQAARVRELATEAALFASTTWTWSRHHAAPPARLTPIQVELWHALSNAPVPTSKTHLKRILAGTNNEHETPAFDG